MSFQSIAAPSSRGLRQYVALSQMRSVHPGRERGASGVSQWGAESICQMMRHPTSHYMYCTRAGGSASRDSRRRRSRRPISSSVRVIRGEGGTARATRCIDYFHPITSTLPSFPSFLPFILSPLSVSLSDRAHPVRSLYLYLPSSSLSTFPSASNWFNSLASAAISLPRLAPEGRGGKEGVSSFRLISHSFSFLKDEVGLRKSGAEGRKGGREGGGRMEDKLTEQEKPQRNSPVPPCQPAHTPARSKALQNGREKASESHFLRTLSCPFVLSPSLQSFFSLAPSLTPSLHSQAKNHLNGWRRRWRRPRTRERTSRARYAAAAAAG